MTSKHTPEPWHIGAMESGQVAIDAANGSEITGWLDPDDARRIVACVNACAGLDTEYLETVGLPEFAGKQLCADMVQRELDAVIAQRDQLLAALGSLMPVAKDWCDYRGNPQSLEEKMVAARAAIAKATGGAE